MASLLQGFKNFKASVGSAASEMQHIANQLQGSGIDEKRFLEAIYSNNCTLAASLLTANPNVIYARTKDWHNAWHIAAQAGSLQMLDVLHTHGRGATRKPLPGEPPQHAAKTRDSSKTPLMLACAANHLNAMHYLLGVGASPRDGDKYGNTIVHYAALNGQSRMLSILLAIDEGASSDVMATSGGPGSNVNAVTSTMTELRVGGENCQQQVMATVNNQPNIRLVEVRNEAGLMPLHFAVWGGNPATVAAILEHGPDLVAKSYTDSMAQVTCNGGSTPLHVAALRNSPPMVDALLQAYVKAVNEGRGPRQDIRTVQDNYKFTPHSLALDLGREVVLGLLEPNYKLHGLDAAAAEAAVWGDIGTLRQLRRSLTGAGASMKRTSVSSLADDGFAALAAGALRSPRSRHPSSPGIGKNAKMVVPALTPPPPPTAKAGKAVAALLTPTVATSAPSIPITTAHNDDAQPDDSADATPAHVIDPPSQFLPSSRITAAPSIESTSQPVVAGLGSPQLANSTHNANNSEASITPVATTNQDQEQQGILPTSTSEMRMHMAQGKQLPSIESGVERAHTVTMNANTAADATVPLDVRIEPASSQAASCNSVDFLCIGRSHICPEQEGIEEQCPKSASYEQPEDIHDQASERSKDENQALQLQHEPTLSVQQGLLLQHNEALAPGNNQHSPHNQTAMEQSNDYCSSSPEHELQTTPELASDPSQVDQVYLDHIDDHTDLTTAAPAHADSKVVSVALTSNTQTNITPSSSGDSSYCIVPANGCTAHSTGLPADEAPGHVPVAATADEDANSVDSADYPPAEYLCPITNQFMVCPVIAADGRAYEEDAISMWMSLGNTEFPGGGKRIMSRHLTPATELKQQITAWRSAHGV